MAPTDDLKAPLYHAPGRITFVSRARPLLVEGLVTVERCGIGGCDRRASHVADAVLDEAKRGQVRICAYHATPLDELPEA